VAAFVLEGASRQPAKDGAPHAAVLYAPRSTASEENPSQLIDALQKIKTLPNLRLEDRMLGKSGYAGIMISHIAEADLVVLLGGGEGTAGMAYAAISVKKPCIGITSLGGAARDVSEDILEPALEKLAGQAGLSADDLRALHAPWTADEEKNRAVAEAITAAAEKIVQAQTEARARPWYALVSVLAAMCILLSAWLGVYFRFGGSLPSAPAAFFLLLFIAALLGVGARLLAGLQAGAAKPVTFPELLVDGVIALLVAFGLALVYLIGGIAFTGRVIILEPANAEAFAGISITMTLLGLTAGFLLPFHRLRNWLAGVILEGGR
jgi:hypothetical protein